VKRRFEEIAEHYKARGRRWKSPLRCAALQAGAAGLMFLEGGVGRGARGHTVGGSPRSRRMAKVRSWRAEAAVRARAQIDANLSIPWSAIGDPR
jgi:hypothetical protein